MATDLSEDHQDDVWSTRAYVIGEILISLVALVGAGLILTFRPTDLAASAALTAIPAIIVFWFQRRASEQATSTVKQATNGAIKQLSDKVDLINNQGTYGSTQHIMALQAQMQQLINSNVSRLDAIDAEKKKNGGV